MITLKGLSKVLETIENHYDEPIVDISSHNDEYTIKVYSHETLMRYEWEMRNLDTDFSNKEKYKDVYPYDMYIVKEIKYKISIFPQIEEYEEVYDDEELPF